MPKDNKRTLKVVSGKAVESTEISAEQIDRRIERKASRIAQIDKRIVSLDEEKTKAGNRESRA